MRRLALRWLALTLAIAAASALLPGVEVGGGVSSYLWIALLFAAVNMVLGPVLRLLTAPLILVTLGLFSLVVNGVLVLVTDWLSSSLDVDGFLNAVLASLVISAVSFVVSSALHPARGKEPARSRRRGR